MSEPVTAANSPAEADRVHPAERAAMDAAVRLAWRQRGRVEPNPCVGCAILPAGAVGAAGDAGAAGAAGVAGVAGSGPIAIAAHRIFGGPHAETLALQAAGERARGATAVVTLEPCDHHGKQPPCTEALIAAGIARVVYAVADPHPEAAGGAARLRAAGIQVVHAAGHVGAEELAAPFVHRVRTGLPWVVAKWAQTVDGRIATRHGHSQWISGPRSRRLVHRERGRVDVLLTGVGTVLADDPELTPRHGSVRRMPMRVVADSFARTPADARLLQTVDAGPVVIAVRADALAEDVVAWRAQRLRDAGAEILPLPTDPPEGDDGWGSGTEDPADAPPLRGFSLGLAPGSLDLAALLRRLADRGAARVMVEAGGILLGRLFAHELVQEAWVFTGPRLLGDGGATPPVAGHAPRRIEGGIPMRLHDLRRRDDDVIARWRVGPRPRSGDRT